MDEVMRCMCCPHLGRHYFGLERALDLELDMFATGETDGEQIPALYVRVGLDRGAYEFLKWRASDEPFERLYPFFPAVETNNQPFLDESRSTDMLESLDVWSFQPGSVIRQYPNITVLALIKVRLLLDLRTTQNAARGLSGLPLPMEIIDVIRGHLDYNSIPQSGRMDLLYGNIEDTSARIETLKKQLIRLWYIVAPSKKDFGNRDFHSKRQWLRHTFYIEYPVGRPGIGSCWSAWQETPGAGIVDGKLTRTMRDLYGQTPETELAPKPKPPSWGRAWADLILRTLSR